LQPGPGASSRAHARPFRYGRQRPPRGHHHALHRRSC
jgi:hypothetical protein